MPKQPATTPQHPNEPPIFVHELVISARWEEDVLFGQSVRQVTCLAEIDPISEIRCFIAIGHRRLVEDKSVIGGNWPAEISSTLRQIKKYFFDVREKERGRYSTDS